MLNPLNLCVPSFQSERNLVLLDRWLEGTSAYENFLAFFRRLVEPFYRHYGAAEVEGEHSFDKFARYYAIYLGCYVRYEQCLTDVVELLDDFVFNDVAIAPDLQFAVFCSGVREANSTTFDFLLDMMLQSDYQAQRTSIQNALGCANSAEDLTRYLELALRPGNNRLNLVERVRIFTTPAESMTVGVQVMTDFVQVNYEEINGIQQGLSNSILSTVSIRITSQELFETFDTVLVELEEAELITEDFANGLRANANSNFEWQEKFVEEIRDLLQAPTA